MLEFKVLGGLRVLVDGEELPVENPLDRAILTGLLAEPNRRVPPARLLQYWSEPAPTPDITAVDLDDVAIRLSQFLDALPGDTQLKVALPDYYLLKVNKSLIDATMARAVLAAAPLMPLQRRVALLKEARALWPRPRAWRVPSSNELSKLRRNVSRALADAENAVRQSRPAAEHRHRIPNEDLEFDQVDQLVRPPAGALLTATDTLSVSMYLSDDGQHTAVEAAVERVLARAGLSVIDRDPPVLGSWFRKLRASDLGATAAHAADSRLVLAHDAQVTSTMLQHLGPVITALQPTKDAVVRIGAILIVKLDDQLAVHQLTAAQQLQLDHQPQLAMSPREILTALELEPAEETGT